MSDMMSYIDNTVYVTLQWNESSEKQILLRNMDFEASGTYCCEVSMQTPIYTKLSNEHELTVIRKCAGGGSTEHVSEFVRCVQSYMCSATGAGNGVREGSWNQEETCEMQLKIHISDFNRRHPVVCKHNSSTQSSSPQYGHMFRSFIEHLQANISQ
jgi:hypothetical protein